jgi:DNA-binding transcriptional LysR family regulator
MRMTRVHYDLHDVRALCEVARTGGFREAADALSISTSALSRRIAKLEESVGGLLVRRTTRSVGLTPLGRRLLSRAEPLINGLDDCVHEAARMAKGMEGQIAIGCVASIAFGLIAPVMARFRQDHPNLRLCIKDGTGAEITNAVMQHEIEIGITSTLGTHHKELYVERVASDPFVLLLPPRHPLSQRASLTWSEITQVRLMGYPAASPLRSMLDRRLAAEGIELSWFDEVATISSHMGYLQTGAFASVVPKLVARHLTALVAVELKNPVVKRDIFLIRRADQEQTAPVRRLWHDIRTRIEDEARGLAA